MSGVEQLREQLTAMGEALRAFDDPIVNQVPGLRLMHQTLKERQGHIEEQIQKNETCSLTLTLHDAAREGRGLPVGAALSVLDPLAAAVTAAALAHVSDWPNVPDEAVVAEAAELHLAELELDDNDATLLLTRRPGELRAQLSDPDSSAPVIEHALADVTRALNGEGGPAPAEAQIQALAAWVVDTGCVLTWEFSGYVLGSAESTLDRTRAQRLVSEAVT